MTRAKWGGWAALWAAPFFVSACGSLVRQPANVEATREDVTAMRREQTEMMALLLELRTRLDSQSEAVSALKADTNLELQELSDKIDALIAGQQDQSSRSDRPRSSPDPTPARPETSAAGTSSASVQASYDGAKRDFSRGNYQLAINGFDEVLQQDPKGSLADDAQYWKGEAYYSLGQLDRAIQELLRVRDVFPKSNLVCGATYKVGLAFMRKEDAATARRYFDTVIRECPNSPEAPAAKDKLKQLH
jgi:tol-pal system protein YbgF